MLALSWAVAAAGATAADGATRSFLMSTEWRWNGWNNVKFHAPTRREADAEFAKFYAPTADCEANLCTWTVVGGTIRIRWGDAGWHTIRRDGPDRLEGVRDEDKSPCTAVLVGSFEEKLYDLDLYSIVGVAPNASSADVKRAFRRGSLSHHPDKAGTAEEFVTLRGAYEILADAAERARYDEQVRLTASAVDPTMVETLDPGSFARLVDQRPVGSPPWLVVYTMSPSSPCGPCHDARAEIRKAAEALRHRLRVGVIHCDVHAELCQASCTQWNVLKPPLLQTPARPLPCRPSPAPQQPQP